ncbi:hypothetical protein [Luteococcus japonicus]|uniref:hypothetical protein n=1 Tax=Luteococcus japonicus TaxID=33984 RepID=UPI000B9BF1B1|nr:hypothetical protein [Luteococcus japonicus]
MPDISAREAYIYYFKYYLNSSPLTLKRSIVGLWVSDPLDITQVIYRQGGGAILRGIARRQPVEDGWEEEGVRKPPNLEIIEPPRLVDVVNHLDAANSAIHFMAMISVLDISEPHEIEAVADGVGWIGEPTALLPDSCRVPL